jgi:hypothetical protein
VTIKAQVDEGFTLSVMALRRAIADELPGWVTVSARCDVFRRVVRVTLDGPWYRGLLTRHGRSRLLQRATSAGAQLLPPVELGDPEQVPVRLEVRWR